MPIQLDHSLPADNSPISSAELRGQFQAIQDTLNDLTNKIDNLNNRIMAIPDFGLNASDPPTFGEVQAIADALQSTIGTLKS